MDIRQDNFEHYEITMWEMLKSLTDVKNCIQNTSENKHEELVSLKNKLMEAGEWLNKFTIESQR
jgi:hypothetical protein